MRIFLAVFPTSEAQGLAYAAGQSLRQAAEREGVPANSVSWVRPENLHYTVRFIGEVGEDGARRIAEAAQEAARGCAPFEATLGAPGAFQKPRDARVLWIGLVTGEAPFADLALRLERALERRGFTREKRPFSAHLTLGRVRRPSHDWTGALAGAASLALQPAARFTVSGVSVVASTLSPQGSRYDVRAEAVLSL
jgi:2'-5' RNA ligase